MSLIVRLPIESLFVDDERAVERSTTHRCKEVTDTGSFMDVPEPRGTVIRVSLCSSIEMMSGGSS